MGQPSALPSHSSPEAEPRAVLESASRTPKAGAAGAAMVLGRGSSCTPCSTAVQPTGALCTDQPTDQRGPAGPRAKHECCLLDDEGARAHTAPWRAYCLVLSAAHICQHEPLAGEVPTHRGAHDIFVFTCNCCFVSVRLRPHPLSFYLSEGVCSQQRQKDREGVEAPPSGV